MERRYLGSRNFHLFWGWRHKMEIAFQILIKKLVLIFRKQIYSKKTIKNSTNIFIKLIPDQLSCKGKWFIYRIWITYFLLLFFFLWRNEFLPKVIVFVGLVGYFLFTFFFKWKNGFSCTSQWHGLHIARNKTIHFCVLLFQKNISFQNVLELSCIYRMDLKKTKGEYHYLGGDPQTMVTFTDILLNVIVEKMSIKPWNTLFIR